MKSIHNIQFQGFSTAAEESWAGEETMHLRLHRLNVIRPGQEGSYQPLKGIMSYSLWLEDGPFRPKTITITEQRKKQGIKQVDWNAGKLGASENKPENS